MANKRNRAGRNRNGVGNVRQLRNNLFQASIQLAPGDRRTVSARTRADAEQKLAELRVLYQQGRLPPKSAQTVREYLQSWLAEDVKPSKAPTTYGNYALNVRRLDPYIGACRLDGLKPELIKSAYRSLTERGLSARSVQQAHRILRAALRQAVRSEHIYRDPTFGVVPPRAPQRDDSILTADQVRRLLSSTKDDEYYCLWAVLASTGVRLGEALGLQWRDIDFESGSLAIRRQAQRQPSHGIVLSELKTKASYRSLPLVPGALSALRSHRDTQRERFVVSGIQWNDTAQVFSTADGGLLDAGSIGKAFHRALESAHLPRVRVHDLRHTVSSFLQSRGRTGREAQEILGHASENTTRLIYTHVMPDRRSEVIIPVQEFFREQELGSSDNEPDIV